MKIHKPASAPRQFYQDNASSSSAQKKAPAQMMGLPEKEELQMKPDPLQFVQVADEEELQMKKKPMQMMGYDDEEKVQMKPMQLMGYDEEEELQMKPMQMQGIEEEEVQMKLKPMQFHSAEPEKVQMKSDTSTKMPENVQAKMESSFGADFSNVNIHVGEQASSVGALAYAQGNDIHFAPGQYNPETQSGQELLGHELTHVVQQRQGRVQATTQAKGLAVNDDPALEQEADEMGRKAASGEQFDSANNTSGSSTSLGIQKKGDGKGKERMATGVWVHLSSGEEVDLGDGDGTPERAMMEFGWGERINFDSLLNNPEYSKMGTDLADFFRRDTRKINTPDNDSETDIGQDTGSFFENLKSLLSGDAGIVIYGTGEGKGSIEMGSKRNGEKTVKVLDLGDPENVFSILQLRNTGATKGAYDSLAHVLTDHHPIHKLKIRMDENTEYKYYEKSKRFTDVEGNTLYYSPFESEESKKKNGGRVTLFKTLIYRDKKTGNITGYGIEIIPAENIVEK
ncbi:MAG: DUF4157 domain-containing protein [Cytophagaceae bacterium]